VSDPLYVVDTSVLTRLGKPTVRAAVEPLSRAGRLARVLISDLELGSQARTASEWDAIALALSAMPALLIAAAAEAQGCTVLHYDHDFDLLAGVTSQPVQWVVPPGTAD
jgi:predicted nucleic acid-binding protein